MRHFQLRNFLGDFALNGLTDFRATLHLDQRDGLSRLHKKINLHTRPLCVGRLAERRRRKYLYAIQMKRFQEHPEIIENQILKCKAHDRIPFRQILKRYERITAIGNLWGMWFHIFQIKSGVIVPQSITHHAHPLAAFRIEPVFNRHETGQFKLLHHRRKLSVPRHTQ